MNLPIALFAAVFTLTTLGAGANTALADDSAAYDIGGGAVAPMAQHPTVRMVSETVKVRLNTKSARVHCEFVFRNEGKARIVKMAFPEESSGSGDSGAGGILYGFRSWVDGKPVRCVYKAGKVRTISEQHEELRSWYVKDVPFGAGQTRTVTDEYNTRLGFSNTAGMTEYETPHSFSYILLTGRNWKGPIGRARIIVDISQVPTDRYEVQPSPPGFIADRRTLSWTLKSFEPTEDVWIDLVPRYPRLNGKAVGEWGEWTPFSRVAGVTMTGTHFLYGLGAQMHQDDKNRTIITHNGHTLRLTDGSRKALLDGTEITLQAAPGSGIPVASVVRALGGKARYSQTEKRLFLWLKPRKTKGR